MHKYVMYSVLLETLETKGNYKYLYLILKKIKNYVSII
jgi:hypothetical protein